MRASTTLPNLTRVLRWAWVAAVVSGVGCFGLGDGQPKSALDLPENPTWVTGIGDLFISYCGDCHGERPADSSIGYFRVDTYYNDPGGRLGVFALRDRHLARVANPSRPMPPPPARAMTPDEVDALRRWVDRGAPYDDTDTGVGSDPRCTPGELGACACPGGYYGGQVCLDDGSYEECDCGAGGGPGPGGEPPAEPILADVVAWVFEPSCSRASSCHAVSGAPPSLVDDGALMSRLLGRSQQATTYGLIEPGFPDQSYLFLKTLPEFPRLGVGSGQQMPNTGQLTSDQVGVLERWITAGAPE